MAIIHRNNGRARRALIAQRNRAQRTRHWADLYQRCQRPRPGPTIDEWRDWDGEALAHGILPPDTYEPDSK